MDAGEIMEIISMASLATYVTTMADALKVDVDEDFNIILES